MLSPKLLKVPRAWWPVEPKQWLFPGDRVGNHITKDSVEQACQKARQRCGISKPITPHSLRHCFATHLESREARGVLATVAGRFARSFVGVIRLLARPDNFSHPGYDRENRQSFPINRPLIPNSFHIFEQHLLAAAVIEFRGAAVSVAGNPLRGLKGPVVFQKIRDTGCPE